MSKSSNFGTGEMFFCFVVGGLVATAVYGWRVFVALALFVHGYNWLMKAVNDTFYPNGDLRRRRKRGRGRRW